LLGDKRRRIETSLLLNLLLVDSFQKRTKTWEIYSVFRWRKVPLEDQVLLLTTQESYKIHTSFAPLLRLMEKTIEIPLDDFGEFEVVSECIESTDFGFEDVSLGISEGKE